MAINIGDDLYSSVSIGTDSIQRIHVGSDLYYQRNLNVPSNLVFRSDPSSINEDSLVLLPDNIQLSWSADDATMERVYNKRTGMLIGSRSPASTPRPQYDESYGFVASNVSGQNSLDITVPVNRAPIISNLTVRYLMLHQIHGITAEFTCTFVGKPVPTFSANQGIGNISNRHIDVAAGRLTFTHYFGTSGRRQVTLTATNRNGSDDESVFVDVP